MSANCAKALQASTATVGDAGEIFNAPAGAAMSAPDTAQDALLPGWRDLVPQKLRRRREGMACHAANLPVTEVRKIVPRTNFAC